MAIADRYELQTRMGEGGFSRVFRGQEKTTGRPVALKVLKSAFYQNVEVRERFQREVFAVASLSNPHIVGMYDFDLNSDDLYIAMEYVAGQTLRERMRDDFTIEQRFSILSQVGDAIAAAHERNVVHRDLKPENIKVVSQPAGALEVKVLDFGMAKLTDLESRLELEPLTRAGTCFGTPQYMSPEQIRGKLDDKSIDLYALAIIAYELLTGRRPWDGVEPYEVMRAVLRQPAPRVTKVLCAEGDVPLANERVVALNAFFERALAKQKEQRPADAHELLAALEDALFGQAGAPEELMIVAAQTQRADDTLPFDSAVASGRLAAILDATGPVPSAEATSTITAPTASITTPIAAESTVEVAHVETSVDVTRAVAPMGVPAYAGTAETAALTAMSLGASRRAERSWRSLLLPLLVLAALGGSLGYVLAGSASAQSNEMHDFIVGNR